MEKQEVPAAGYITFLLLVITTSAIALFFASDAFDESYHDGWRYFLPLVIFDLVFTLAAIIYLFRKKWWLVGYTVLLALPMNTVIVKLPWPVLLSVAYFWCCLSRSGRNGFNRDKCR